jgi:hypothetical protein
MRCGPYMSSWRWLGVMPCQRCRISSAVGPCGPVPRRKRSSASRRCSGERLSQFSSSQRCRSSRSAADLGGPEPRHGGVCTDWLWARGTPGTRPAVTNRSRRRCISPSPLLEPKKARRAGRSAHIARSQPRDGWVECPACVKPPACPAGDAVQHCDEVGRWIETAAHSLIALPVRQRRGSRSADSS